MSKRRSRASGAMVSYAEVKNYLSQREIPQLFESLMAGLMYHRPENHIGYLQSCLDEVRSGSETRVQWSTFVNAKKRKSKEILPPLTPKKQDSFSSWSDNSRQSTPLPPISAKARTPPESKNTYILYHNPPPVLAKPQVPVLFVLGGPGAKTDELCEQVVARLRGLVHISICSMLKTRMTIEGFHRLTSVPACAVVDSVLQAMSMVKSAGALLVAGFPRNRGDIEEYRSRGVRMDGVVLVDFEEDALRRFLKHEIANPADVELELERYKQDIISVAEYYDNKDLLTVVMGDQDMEDIIEDLVLSVDRVIETRKNTEGFWDDDEGGNPSRGRPSTVEIRDATEEDLASMQTENPKVKAASSLDENEKEGDITNNDDVRQETNAGKSFDEEESDETKPRSEMEHSTASKLLEEDERKEVAKMELTSPIIDERNVQKPEETAEDKPEATVDDEFPTQRIPLLCALENLNLIDEEKIRDFIANELGMCFIDYCQLVLDDKTSNSVEGLRLLQNVLKQDEVSYSKGFFIYKFPFELLNVKDVEQILKLGYVSFISDETKGETEELNLLLQSSLRDRIGLIFTTESKLEDELRRFLQDFKCVTNGGSLQSQESVDNLKLTKETSRVEESNRVEETNDHIPNAVESETAEKDVHSKNNIDDDNTLLKNKSTEQSATNEDSNSEESDKESSKESVTDTTKDEIAVEIHNHNQQIHEAPGEVAESSEELKQEAISNEEIQLDEKSEKSENGKISEEEDTNEGTRKVDEDVSGFEITPVVVKDDQSIKSDDLAEENEVKQICTAVPVQNSEQEENDNKNSNGESEVDEEHQKIKRDEISAYAEENMDNQEPYEGNQTSSPDQSCPSGQEKMPVEQEPSENQGNEDLSLENDNKQINGENEESEVNAPAGSESTPRKRKNSILSEEKGEAQPTENTTLEGKEKIEGEVDDTDVTINEPGEMIELATDKQEPPKEVDEGTVSEQEIPIKDSDAVSSINDESDAAKEQETQMNREEYAEKNEDHGSGDNEQSERVPVAESEESEQVIQRTENERTPSPKIGDTDVAKEHERIEEDHERNVEEGDQNHETDTDVSTTSVVKSDVLDEDNDTTENVTENENAAPENERENPIVHRNESLVEEREQHDEEVNEKNLEDEVTEQEQHLSEKLINSSNNNLDVEENIACTSENSEDNNGEKSHELEKKDELDGKSHNLAGQEEAEEKGNEHEGQEDDTGKSSEEEHESVEKCQELKGQEESGEKVHELEEQDDSGGKNHELEDKDESADKNQELEGQNDELEEKNESSDKSYDVEGKEESNSIAEEVISETNKEENSECKSPSSEKSLDVGENDDEEVKENSKDQEVGNLNDKMPLPKPDAESEVSETEIKADSEQDEINVTVSVESEHLDDHDEIEVNSQPDNQASDIIEATTTESEEQNQEAEESEKEESQNENSVATDKLSNVTPDQPVEGRNEEENPIHSDASVEDSKLIQREDDTEVSERTWKDSDKTAQDSFSAKRRNGSSRQKEADEDDVEEQERSSSSSRGEL
ncbi:Adenylate kinase isoenzyme 5, partial [Stegodyphus mimosarum]